MKNELSLARKIRPTSFFCTVTSPPFSIYKLADNLCSDNHGNNPISRILHQTRYHKANLLISEEIPESEDIQGENDDLRKRTKDDIRVFQSSKQKRLSFFNAPEAVVSEFKKDDPSFINKLSSENFIGYVILKQNSFTKGEDDFYIFESIIRPKNDSNFFVHTANSFKAKILEKEFQLIGSVYSQMNGKSSLCAHTALVTILSSLEEDNIWTSHHINYEFDIDLSKIKYGKSVGFDIDLIPEYISKIGLRLYYVNSDKKLKKTIAADFVKYLSSSIESGYPALLGFALNALYQGNRVKNHLVPIIGHTFNQDTWVPYAEESYFKLSDTLGYYQSHIWSGSLIMHDDNFGSYLCLPIHYLDFNNIRFFGGILPKEVSTDPVEIEPYAITLLNDTASASQKEDLSKYEWLNRLFKYAQSSMILVRTKLQTKRGYISELRSATDWHNNSFSPVFITEAESLLPERFWQVDLTFQHLYSTHHRKIGEILLRCDYDLENIKRDANKLCLFSRLGEVYDNSPRFGKREFKLFPSGVIGHTEIV